MDKSRNIIWILLDGVRNYHTPNDPEKMGKPDIIDKLAKDSVEFTQAVTSATSTVMSVSSFMTSIPSYYLSRNLEDMRLDKSNFESIGNIIENEGYNVYNVNVSYDLRRDYWKTFLKPVDKKFWPKECKVMEHWGNEPLNKIIFNMIDSNQLKQPFLLYVHYNFRRDFKCNDRVQDLINRLKKENLYDDSIVIAHSDHGMPDAERRDYFKWLGERGLYFNRHDLIMTDDNICVPLTLKYPGCKAGKKIDITVGTIDIVPTILSLLGIDYGPEKKYGKSFRGKNLLPLINGQDLEFYKKRKIRTDTRYVAQTDRMTSIRGTGYKYIYYRDIPSEDNAQFIDLINDPYEENNLIYTKDEKYKNLIKDYKQEYQYQEQDSIKFQYEFLKRKFLRFFDNQNQNKIKKVLVIGSCNYWFMKTLVDIINDYFPDLEQCDIFLERDNQIEYHELNQLGYTNNIFAHHSFNAKEFKKDYLSTMENYDLSLIPLTDYRKDIEQSKKKSVSGEMEIIQPQAPITSRLLKDYEEIFKIEKLIISKSKFYLDYNVNFYNYPKLIIIQRYLKKIIAKSDIYKSKPLELLKDINRLILKK